MNKRFFVLFSIIGLSASLFCQTSLLFLNAKQGKLIKANFGDQLSVQYKGYLGQTETFKHTLSEITDSSMILGYYFPEGTFGSPGMMRSLGIVHKEIMLKDITAFRRMSQARGMLKSTLSMCAALGTIYLLNNFYQNNQFSTLARIGISLGVGLGTNYAVNLCLPEKPKYKMMDGWIVETVK